MRLTLAGFMFSLLVQSINAAEWYVDDDASPGGSGSSADPFSQIALAVAAATGGDTIHIEPGLYAEALVLDKDLILIGSTDGAARLDGQGSVRPVSIQADATVVLRNLLITGGYGATGGGGAISNDHGALTLYFCKIQDNEADGSGGGGGGILNDGDLTMFGCILKGNLAVGGFPSQGGAILNRGSMSLAHCLLESNLCRTMGFSPGASFFAFGGAIYNASLATLLNCTVSGNSVEARNLHYLNTNASAYGGGIYNTGDITLENCTVAYNDAHSFAGDSAIAVGGGLLNDSAGTTMTLNQVIVDENQVTAESTIPFLEYDAGPDCSGIFNSLGYNLVGTNDDFSLVGVGHNLVGQDAMLSPLAHNGGPAKTHALDAGSPAVDSGNPDPTLCPPYDARGYPRALCDPAVGRCDRGAYEWGGVLSFTLNATPESDIPLGTTFYLATCGGVAFERSLLYAVNVQGVPIHLRLFGWDLDAAGGWVIPMSMPNDPALSGLFLTLREYSWNLADRLIASNDEVLTFQ